MAFHDKNPGDKKERHLLKKTAAILAIGGAAAFGAACSNESGSLHASPNTPVASGETVPGQTNEQDPSAMSVAEFTALTRAQQLDYVGPKLNANTQTTTDQLNGALDSMGWGKYNYFNRPVVQPDVNNTPQQIWDQITLGSFQAWKTAQDGNLTEADKLAEGVAEDQEYSDLTATFQNGGSANIPLGVAWDAQPRITSGEYDGVEANGLGLVEFNKTDMISMDKVKVIARFEQGTQANSGRWVLVKTEAL